MWIVVAYFLAVYITPLHVVTFYCTRSRETIKATVFGSSIAPPSMTLEEFAELELADARRREEAQQSAPAASRR